MSTSQETVTPQKPPGGGSVAPSPAALSPVSESEFLTTIKVLLREATRVWAIPVSDHCKGDKEVLIDVVLCGGRVSPCFVLFAEEFRGPGPKENCNFVGVECVRTRSRDHIYEERG